MNAVLWAGIKVSTHRVLRFVSPVNILLWTSLSLFSDNNLRNEGSLLNDSGRVQVWLRNIKEKRKGSLSSDGLAAALGIDDCTVPWKLLLPRYSYFFFFFDEINDLEEGGKGIIESTFDGVKFSLEKKNWKFFGNSFFAEWRRGFHSWKGENFANTFDSNVYFNSKILSSFFLEGRASFRFMLEPYS